MHLYAKLSLETTCSIVSGAVHAPCHTLLDSCPQCIGGWRSPHFMLTWQQEQSFWVQRPSLNQRHRGHDSLENPASIGGWTYSALTDDGVSPAAGLSFIGQGLRLWSLLRQVITSAKGLGSPSEAHYIKRWVVCTLTLLARDCHLSSKSVIIPQPGWAQAGSYYIDHVVK